MYELFQKYMKVVYKSGGDIFQEYMCDIPTFDPSNSRD